MKAVELLINSILPEDLRSEGRTFTQKELNDLLYQVGERYPERFDDILKKISSIGRKASYYQGETITLADLASPIDKKALFEQMDNEIANLPKDKNFKKNRREIYQKYNQLMEKLTSEAGLKNRNNISMSVLSGARGKSAQLKAMITSPGTYSDYKGEPIDVFSRESFADGINPATFLASSFGTRSSTVSTKCLSEDTEVRMGDLSVKKIKDIIAGDFVLGADINGRVFPVKVINVFNQGLQDCYRYTYRFSVSHCGQKTTDIVCTKTHKFLSYNTDSTSNCFSEQPIDHSSLYKTFNQKCFPVGPLGGYEGKNYIEKSWQLGYAVGCDWEIAQCAKLFISEAKDELKKYNLYTGKNDSKTIPAGWQHWNRLTMGRFIAGLFFSCGYISRELVKSRHKNSDRYTWRIVFRSHSEKLIKDIKLALQLFFGINGVSLGPKHDKYMRRALYYFSIRRAIDIKKFYEYIDPYVVVNSSNNKKEKYSYVKKIAFSSLVKNYTPFYFKKKEHVGPVNCYDIEVDHPDHLFVLANGMITSNSSTAKGGDWSKQMAQSAADMVVREEDCGTHNGIILPVDDESLKGRALSREVAGIKPGTFITRDVVTRLKKAGIKEIEVRSPLTCSEHNGLCAKCVGKYYNGGKLPKIGQHIGVTASTVTGEPVTQMALCLSENTKVMMADGSSKAIKNINKGDSVMGADKEGNTFSVKVINKFDQGMQTCRDYVLKYTVNQKNQKNTDNKKYNTYSLKMRLTCTPQHKFLTDVSGKKIVQEIEKLNYDSQQKICIKGHTDMTDVTVEYVSYLVVGKQHCYDIEVDHPDHLFVLANGMITSNSAKHTAGMTKEKKTYSGLEVIQQFTQSPEKFKDEGTVATVDGRVDNIEDAPQGGKYITVSGKKHYILPGHEPEVKKGDTVEAGDQLAEGLVDPEDIVKYKGLGEGRRYWAERLNQILADSGAKTDKRNTEVLARATLRHIRITNQDGYGDYLPDDVVDYNGFQASYRPSEETTKKVKPSEAIGTYLQRPELHYTIGTRITPKVAKYLQDHDHNEVEVDATPPGFEPEMIRLRTASHSNPDWMASLGTSYLTKQLNESATKGDDTNVLHNDNWGPRLAFGKNFGKNIEQTGQF